MRTHKIYFVASYRNNPKYWDRQTWANSVDPDQMQQNGVSDQGLHCLSSSFILDAWTGSKIDLIKFQDKYGKELRCPNT